MLFFFFPLFFFKDYFHFSYSKQEGTSVATADREDAMSKIKMWFTYLFSFKYTSLFSITCSFQKSLTSALSDILPALRARITVIDLTLIDTQEVLK